ncbi:hypothetical protein ACF061_00335 [Streptomyces sp. NPDC015220]|uniref:hypothetical protein n=1 Tax=Streptomyces sp. NPDC015220 TaxID=3364947 RepID=UPI0036FD966C
MGTRGAPRSGATALGARLAPVFLAGVLTAGCGGGATGTGHGAPPRSPSPPPSSTMSAEELCVRIVTHWSEEVLDGDTYGDYQSMGLSNGQYEILRRTVAAARTVERRQGREAAHESIERRARAGCAARYRRGNPGTEPWR